MGVYRRKDRKGSWWISYKNAAGERCQEPSRQPTKKRAQDLLVLRMAAAKMLSGTCGASGKLPPTKADEKEKAEREKRDAVTFAEVGERYMAFQKTTLTAAAYTRSKGIVEGHLTAAFGPKRLGEITREDVEQYIGARKGLVSPASIAKELNTLKHLLGKCIDWNLVAVNAAHRVKAPKVPSRVMGDLQPADVTRVLLACPEWLQPIAALLVFTGMRRSECLSLQWSWINRKANVIVLPKTKNGKIGYVRLNALAWAVLDRIPRSPEVPEVFPPIKDERGRLINSTQNTTVCFRRVCKAAKFPNFRLHDLRHTFASRLVNEGVPLQHVSELLRHSDLRMTMRYAHLQQDRLQASCERLDTIFADILPPVSGSTTVVKGHVNVSQPLLMLPTN